MARVVTACEKILCDENSLRVAKSLPSAEAFKKGGNADYSKKRLPAALGKYTEALCLCPSKETSALVVIYGNRSAVLFELSEYEACLEDISRALLLNPDADLNAKLYLRRFKCLKGLKKATKEEEISAANIIDTATNVSSRKKLLEEFRKARADGAKDQADGSPLFRRVELPPVRELLGRATNPVLTCGSSKVDLRWDEGVGRHVVSLEDLEPGETIFVEKPYASILLPGFHRSLCHFCHGRLLSPVPCHGCVEARFCDESCREKATDSFHKYECGWSKLFDSIGVGHLALRVLTTAGAARIFGAAGEDPSSGDARIREEKEVFKDVRTALDSSDYSSVWRLEHHAEKTSPKDAVVYEKNCVLLIRFLETRTSFFQDGLAQLKSTHPTVTLEKLVSVVGSALHKHVHQMIVNAHAIGHVMEETSDVEGEQDPLVYFSPCGFASSESGESVGFVPLKETKVATGIFACAGMMNHSCEPNIATSFVNNTIVVRTAQKIKKGGDLLNCYGPYAKRRSKKSRKKELKLQYFFDCKCTACENPSDGVWRWLDGFACQECGAALDSVSSEDKCPSCGKLQDVHALEERLEESNRLWEQGMDDFDARNPTAIDALVKAMEIRESVLYKHNRNRGFTYDSLARCYAIIGQYEASLFYLDLSLACVAARFGDESVEYGYELQKYLEICVMLFAQISAGKKVANGDEIVQNSVASFKKGLRIFCTMHGPWSESVQNMHLLGDCNYLPFFEQVD